MSVTATRLARNAATALGSQVALGLLALITTAILVRELGAVGFGAWALVGAFFSYGTLLDLGLGGALVRRAARAYADGDTDALGRAAGAALLATAILGLLSACGLALAAEVLTRALHIPDATSAEFTAAIRIAALGVGLAVPCAALGAIPTALQRLDAVVRLDFIVSLVMLLAQAGLALAGGGLLELTVVAVAARLAVFLGRFWLMRAQLGAVPLRLDPRYPFWEELGRFSAWKVLHHAASQLVLHLDRFLVAALVSVQAVAVYSVALELAQRLSIVHANVSLAYFPAASAASRARDRATLASLHERTSRIVALATYPLACVLVILAEPLLDLWVGPAMGASAAGVLVLLAIAHTAMALTAVPVGTADALGRPELAARYGIASVAINVALTLLLLPRIGVLGSGVAILCSNALLMPVFLRAATKMLGLPLRPYVARALLAPLLPAAVLATVLAAARWIGVASHLAGLIAALVAAGVAFVAAVRMLRVLDDTELAFLARAPGGRWLSALLGGSMGARAEVSRSLKPTVRGGAA